MLAKRPYSRFNAREAVKCDGVFYFYFFRESNERLFRVLRAGELRETQSQKIRVGDVVHLRDGELIPCDLVNDTQFEYGRVF